MDDERYRRAKEQVEDLESSLSRQVNDYLEGLNGGSDALIAGARLRMEELFRSTKGFGVGNKPSREEMHERRSVR